MPTELVATWYGTFLVRDGRVVEERRFAPDADGLAERLRERREGHLAPEEELLARDAGPTMIGSRDRRFERLGVGAMTDRPARPELPTAPPVDLREMILAEADRALERSWDPSVHLEEAVRAGEEIDRVRNLLGERLASWVGRDLAPAEGEEGAAPEIAAPGVDPSLLEARQRLTSSYEELGDLRRSLDAALEAASSRTMPNLSALLGPSLAARLVAQAGGLDRLARLPASTVQVLGAEKAFFDHLRRGTRPPRHGLLFLHPTIHVAGRKARGRLARALAGKAAIAARLDLAGRPVAPELLEQFERRAREISHAPKGGAGGRARRSAPLDRASEDR